MQPGLSGRHRRAMPLGSRPKRLLTDKEVHDNIQAWLGRTGVSNMDDLANLEEAFRYQSMELQRERENQNNLQMQLLKLQEQKN